VSPADFGLRCRFAFLLPSFAVVLGCSDGGSLSGTDSGPLGLDASADGGKVDVGSGIEAEARADGNVDVLDAAIDVSDARVLDVAAREIAREPDGALDATNDRTDVAGA